MRNHIIKSVLWLFVTIVSILVVIFSQIKTSINIPDWIGIIFGALFAVFLERFVMSIQELTDVRTWQKTLRQLVRSKLIRPKDYIRISFSYLYRIKIDGQYFLVKNHRNIDKFQPVGGVYKCDEEELQFLKTEYHVASDNGIRNDSISKNDYRLRVPAKYLRKFVRRFNNYKTRFETVSNLSREFNEELICTNILNRDTFNEIEYLVCGRHYSDITYSTFYHCYELLLADIVELLPTKEQESELRRLQNNNHMFYWATEEEILSEGVFAGSDEQASKITNNARKVLEVCSQELIPIGCKQTIYRVHIR